MTKTWVRLAACRDHDPELFFPVSDSDPSVRAAKFICGTCPVREECLEHAQPFGVWGGLTENERRAARRGRTAADPTPPGHPARVA